MRKKQDNSYQGTALAIAHMTDAARFQTLCDRLLEAQWQYASTPDPKAGCWPNARCQKMRRMIRNLLPLSRRRSKKRKSSIGSACCRLRPPCSALFCWPTLAGSSSSFTKMPNRNAAWITTRDAAGRDSIDTWPWSCWPTVSSCSIA